MTMQEVLGKIDVTTVPEYPCDRNPGTEKNERNELKKVVTAASQICICEGRERTLLTPSFYQSSMHPEKKEVRTMSLENLKGKLLVKTRYFTKVINLEKENVEVLDWMPELQTVDCKKCENCGRCGW